MPLVTMRQLLDEAAKGAYGVGAFNVNNLEQVQAIMEAAQETNSPVIIQASRGARKYANDRFLYHLMEDAKTPADFEYNVRVTREVVEMAHEVGVTVEGELGTLGGIEDDVGSGEVNLTDPDQAVEFVERTGVDALAVAIGTSHGAYKFTSEPDRDVLAMNIIEEINERLPTTHLVMHGSSSVPKELVDIINQYGGEIRPTWGVPVSEIQEGIKHGVRKVNVDTDLRLAATGAIRKAFAEDPSEFDPRYYLKPARAAMQGVVKARMEAFGQAGHAKDYDPISLPDMAVRYREQGHHLTVT